ncbi:Yip1 family protein [Streptomyces sp. DSM 44917]|uniref:Yip1 family protein n=1 Tax=Streptomyces boetiae TaxID=3075541 RepID=A0ABU2LDS4_9ACTN|nr:Yip1 family protein [Streptomyces sp. DSM 44917]MDT0309734.1 Yip1 family protein [Streptomyces sp. DSM 44917]
MAGFRDEQDPTFPQAPHPQGPQGYQARRGAYGPDPYGPGPYGHQDPYGRPPAQPDPYGHPGHPGQYGQGPSGGGPGYGGPGYGGPGGAPGGYDPGPTLPQPGPGPYPGPDGPAAGGPPDPGPAAPPLPWRRLLSGILLRPVATFWHMRDYPVWAPALIVTFLYGLVAVFGLDEARESILESTASTLAPYLLVTGVAMVLGALVLSTVTHNLARQFGGNGHWAPTAGLAMLIMTLTDVPRLALAIFLGGASPAVQVLGWATWLYAGVLFTLMVSRSHEIPWPRALAASGIQLLALLMLIKLGTL